jgi:hypothetical protein
MPESTARAGQHAARHSPLAAGAGAVTRLLWRARPHDDA